MFVLLLVVLGGLQATVQYYTGVQSVGVCYGVNGNNLPSAQEVVELYKTNGLSGMRIYAPNEETLQALRGSNIDLILDVAKETLNSLTDANAASEWVNRYVIPYSQDVKFKYISVGNEIHPGDNEAQYILPVMTNIQNAISSANLQGRIKVSTVVHTTLITNSYPPNNGIFTNEAGPFIKPIINFLVSNGGPFLVNVYPYFAYANNQKDISLEYAVFTQQGNNVVGYQNLFDALLDAVYAALEKEGASDLQIVVTESGWPSEGGIGATPQIASTYYGNLIKRANSGNGTPKRPHGPIETYLFAMFDENLKVGAETEKHFGLFSPNKSPKYGSNLRTSSHPSTSSPISHPYPSSAISLIIIASLSVLLLTVVFLAQRIESSLLLFVFQMVLCQFNLSLHALSEALKGSNIDLILDVAKETLQSLTDSIAAIEWVNKYVTPYAQDVKFKYIAVGNEIHPGDIEAQYILPAMTNIQNAISSAKLQDQIKVSTVIDTTLITNSYPPNNGIFTNDAGPYIKPIINFLVSNGAPLLVNLYPYFAYANNQPHISLAYALFTQQGNNDVGYQNLFDAMLDAIYAALEKEGASNLQIIVSESGWPCEGGDGASTQNAATYYANLISHAKSGNGTPKKSAWPIETFLFALFDENQKVGAETERRFGLFTPAKSCKYQISFN
ncbi:hypothetical protein VNO77_35852 [Canavalia gladiata]|uniref:glucan endo-1,3-beta-D-glucosidase n=1 Tax=Canavalia gladiata TaxID=3824 RepID=A0AAN9K799_CANGL